MESAARAFCENGVAGAEFVDGILRRGSMRGYAVDRGFLFLPSIAPASRTQLSFVLLKRKSLLRNHMTRVIVTASFRPEDRALLFSLNHFFPQKNLAAGGEFFQTLRTKEDVLRFLTAE